MIVTQELLTDVDLSIGFKADLALFASVFIPLDHDGLRSDAVPTAGLEMSF